MEGAHVVVVDEVQLIVLVLTEGDDALWDRYVRRMQAAQATDAQEEARFRQALISFEDPHVARRTADAIFSSTIRTQDRGLMIIPFLQGRRTRDVGWSAVREHWDTDIATAEPLLKQRFVQAVGQLAQQARTSGAYESGIVLSEESLAVARKIRSLDSICWAVGTR